MKLHGNILNMGFCDEVVLYERVMDFYFAFVDLNGGAKVFDEIPIRTLSCWNKISQVYCRQGEGWYSGFVLTDVAIKCGA